MLLIREAHIEQRKYLVWLYCHHLNTDNHLNTINQNSRDNTSKPCKLKITQDIKPFSVSLLLAYQEILSAQFLDTNISKFGTYHSKTFGCSLKSIDNNHHIKSLIKSKRDATNTVLPLTPNINYTTFLDKYIYLTKKHRSP